MTKDKIRSMYGQYRALYREEALYLTQNSQAENPTRLMVKILDSIREQSKFIKSTLIGLVDDTYKPSSSELHVKPGDRHALVQLVFKKHLEIFGCLEKYHSAEGFHLKAAVDKKYKAVNMIKKDELFFNNFYMSLEKHAPGMGNIHKTPHLKYHLRVFAYDSLNGELTKAQFIHAFTLAHDTTAVKLPTYVSQANRFR